MNETINNLFILHSGLSLGIYGTLDLQGKEDLATLKFWKNKISNKELKESEEDKFIQVVNGLSEKYLL